LGVPRGDGQHPFEVQRLLELSNGRVVAAGRTGSVRSVTRAIPGPGSGSSRSTIPNGPLPDGTWETRILAMPSPLADDLEVEHRRSERPEQA
jgi:hypothetical protein